MSAVLMRHCEKPHHARKILAMSFATLNDPFVLDALKDVLSLNLDTSATWDGFRFNRSLDSELFQLIPTESKLLPALEPGILHLNLEDVPLPDLSAPASITDSDVEHGSREGASEQSDLDEAVNVWSLPEVIKKKPQTELITWDTFLEETHSERPSVYLSETGADTYHAILLAAEADKSTKPVKTDALLSALFEMAMGRSSTIFVWSEKERRFTKRLTKTMAEGYSADILPALFEDISRVGIVTRILTERFEASIDHYSPSRVAFFGALKTALYAGHTYLESSRAKVASLLQLKLLIGKIAFLVTTLGECTEAVQSCQTDQAIISLLMAKAASVSIRHSGVGKALQSIFGRVCRPLLEKLGEEIGLGSGRDSDLSTEMTQEGQPIWDGLVHRELSAAILETQQSLTLLRSHASECPILSSSVGDLTNLPTVELGYTFRALSEIQDRAIAYETARKSLLVSTVASSSAVPSMTPRDGNNDLHEPDLHDAKSDSPFHLDLGLFTSAVSPVHTHQQDDLHEQILNCFESPGIDNSPFELDIEQALPLSITPIISAQHRLLSYSVLELLFQQYNFLEHIKLQRHFHLLGHASFSSRLGVALFDPDQISGEGQRRSGAATGLRLQVRDTWPPASSELRLALMGILSDSVVSTTDRALEDSISFAVRDMSVEELERCRDVDSIHALDFLRLQYKPPNEVLGSVISPDILVKYDRVFQLLLRILRLHQLTQSMIREGDVVRPADHKIVFEMHHFVSVVADYCHNTVIDLYWRKFMDVLQDVKSHIDRKDYDRTLRTVKSQDYLREMHERTLDDILHGVFLQKKQSSMRRLLQDIFSTVLRFAATRRTDGHAGQEERQLPARFRVQVKQFLEALRAESRTEYQSSHEEEMESVNLPEYLLLRLDMSGYWSERALAL